MFPEIQLRPEVRAFAEAMELALQQNDHKGGWSGCSELYLVERMREEEAELVKTLITDGDQLPAILKEAADVANFAMMIADVAGALKYPYP